MKVRLGVSTSCLYPLETEKALLKVVQNGCEVTEVFFNAACELENGFIKQLKEIVGNFETEIVSVHPTMSLAESFVLFSGYDRRYREGLEQYKRYAEIASELGAKYIIMHGGKPNGVLSDEQYFERFCEIAGAVRQNGAVLLQENVAKYRASDLEFLKKMRGYDESISFCLDVKQAIRGGNSPYDVIKALGSAVKHLHLSDSNSQYDCMLPLSGTFDFAGFIKCAADNGFCGDAVIEVYKKSFDTDAQLFGSFNGLKKITKNF